jgi:outer membrane protein assembly factor BamB
LWLNLIAYISPLMGERMELQNATKIVVAILATLLVLSTLVLLGHSVVIEDSIEATPLSPTKDYGDIMQYEWPTGGANEGQTGFSAGPAPDRPNILWRVPAAGSGFVTVFNGKCFVAGAGWGQPSTLRAYDAFTGDLEWTSTLLGMPGFGTGGVTKIDDTYLYVDVSGTEVHRISDGTFVSNYTVPYYSGHPGSAQYFPGTWSSTLKMKFVLSYDTVQQVGLVNAINLSDPTNPELAWTYIANAVSEIQGYGDGKLFVGTTACTLYALNATTGDFLWESPKTGVVQQHGFYYNGNFYHAASSQCMSCWDGDTGEVLWEYDASALGERAYFAYRGAAGYGRVYDCAIPNDPHGWVVCWDAETGELLWKQPGYYNIAYNTVAVADGKVYASKCDSFPGSVTAGLVMPGYAFACFDAFTGAELWAIEGLNVATPSIAYGNLYFLTGGYLYCIGESTPAKPPAKPWSFGYLGNLEQPRVAVGQSGPEDLSTPKWVFATDGKITSSPAVVDGKVYIGSDDHNWYCLDAYTGKKIWDFPTEYKVGASAAVVDGRVYTGADDGNIYCLDANTGTKIWETYAGGLFTTILMPQELQSRSSPIVVDNKLYVGALDGKVYCLRTSDGGELWTYTTGDPIGGSPAYSDGVIYIASTDTYMYALNATDGALIWKSIGINLDVIINPIYYYAITGTPVVVGDVVYIAAGATHGILEPPEKYQWGFWPPGGVFGGAQRMAAFNATTGALIWNQTLAGNSGSVWVPTHYDGSLYIPEHMRVSQMDATNPNSGPAQPLGFAGQPAGNRTWSQWIGYQILSSVAIADDIRGPKVYVGSDVGSVSCLDAATGAPISAYQTGANVEGSPTIWEGKLYIGSGDRNVYCFDDSPTVDFSISAAANKGVKMWSNETVVIDGRLVSNPNEMVWDGDAYVPVAGDLHPGMPNVEVKLSFTKPDGSDVPLATTTDNEGYFSFSYSPTELGTWGWVVYYDGERTKGLIYNAAWGEWNVLNVTSPTTPNGEPTNGEPPPEGIPAEYIYAVVAVIAIIIIAVVAYVYVKRGKK